MKRMAVLCATLLFAASAMLAGERLDLKAVAGGDFAGEALTRVEPMADGETYAQISKDGKQVVKYSFKTGKQVGVIFDANAVRGANIGSIDGYVMSPDGRRMLIQTHTKRIYRRSFTAEYYIYTLGNSSVVPLSDGGPQQTPIFSPDGNQIAFVRDNNIFLVKLLYDNAESQVTKDGKRNEVINGIPDWVNEEEFATNSSMVFTADSKQICWIRYDESAVKEYSMQMFKGSNPSMDEYADYPGFYSYKYPVAGGENSKVAVYSYDIKSRQTRKMQLPLDADGYIPRIKMTSDPTKVAIFTLNRHQDNLSIYMANPLSTVCQLVIQDKVDKYFKEEAMANIKITDRHILMPSDRDGYMHLYLYTLGGQLKRRVTRGNYEVTDVYGYDEATGDVYYAANELGPQDKQVYVAHQNGKTERLTAREGYNSATFSAGYKYFINTWSDINTPVVYTLNNNSGKVLSTLVDNKGLREKLAAYDLGTRELFSFTTSEGVKLNGWMVKPAGFDASRRYPVIMYQYGGPGNQQVLNSWNIGMCGQGALLEQYMAQQGYIVVCVDGRGTGGRGAEFEKCTYLRLGELEAKDQVETALWLGSQPYVDKNRIGIWGWSYGGWNTLMSMSEGRPVFRAGVAVAPPTSWRYYDTVYSERYMRTPKENPSGYDEVNPMARVDKLSGALLICHGLADDNVHFQNTAEYTEALVQADKDFKENIYTNRNHSIYGGNTRNHLFRQIVNFFNAEMK
ncbi:S9 family peptidase [Marseilla massiliensis]|uniref:S9 family peptidase n=1 Tax=Marseilla massiliensis TaxID=1841864 RepID=UPI0020125A30|nr:S9 family peptidase [Marseilla massiliensis]MCL1609175.1 S9 family peptidase [Marseilla massiliensis]